MEPETAPLASAQAKFLAYLKNQHRSISTILAYGKDVEQLVSFLGAKKITQASSVTPEILEAFKADFAEKKYTLKSISRKLNSVKTFFKFLKLEGLIEQDPAASVSHPKYETKPPRVLSKMEYRALRDACRGDIRMAAAIEIMLQTGIRIGELARLELSDIKGNEIFIKSYESQSERTVPLNKAAKAAVDHYLAERSKTKNQTLFVTKTGRPLLVRNIRTSVNRFFRLAGIEDAKVNDLRNTWIVYHLIAGAPVVWLSKIAGHKRLSTTEKYLQFVKEKAGEEKAKLEEL